MARYVSKEGVWHPAKERIALKNLSGKVKEVDGEKIQPKEQYIYKGADRAALYEMFKEGVSTFGRNFREDPDFRAAIRNQGFNSVEEYLKAMGYDEEKANKDFEEKAAVVHKDELPEKVAAIKTLGGGVDTAGGGKDRYGGFGSQPEG